MDRLSTGFLMSFSSSRNTARKFAIALIIVGATASLAIACSVPVFRYALEHWRPDPYVVYVFHDSELTEEQQASIDTMQPKSADGAIAINVAVKKVNVTTNEDPDIAKIWEQNPSDTLPSVVVQSPPKWGPPQTVWQGDLSKANAEMVMDSPIRRQIGKRLVDGDSVVWVLLECGDKKADDDAFEVLSAELKKLQTELKLPEIEEEDLDDLAVEPDSLKIAFSAVRVSRDDPKERALVEMLVRVEADLQDEDIASQPMAFPVFGRGRALYALVGKGIVADVIKEASQFLTGACQCTVKAQNPGVDLIMNVDWDQQVVPTEAHDEDLPPLAGFAGFAKSDDQDEVTSAEETATAESETVIASAEPVIEASGEVATDESVPATGDESSEESIVATEVSAEAGTSSVDADEEMLPGVGNNVMYVVLFLVVGVALATLLFRPKV